MSYTSLVLVPWAGTITEDIPYWILLAAVCCPTALPFACLPHFILQNTRRRSPLYLKDRETGLANCWTVKARRLVKEMQGSLGSGGARL